MFIYLSSEPEFQQPLPPWGPGPPAWWRGEPPEPQRATAAVAVHEALSPQPSAIRRGFRGGQIGMWEHSIFVNIIIYTFVYICILHIYIYMYAGMCVCTCLSAVGPVGTSSMYSTYSTYGMYRV